MRLLAALLLGAAAQLGPLASIAQAQSQQQSAAVPLVSVSNSNEEYFRLMRQYLGEEAFAQHPCLARQEKDGWVPRQALTAGQSMHVWTLGVEGAGHHATKVRNC